MNEHPISDLMKSTMEKIKETVDANTVIGKAVCTPDGTTVIPISRVTFGFASGGTDHLPKSAKESAPLCFGGGGGAGVTVIPVAFLVIDKNGTRILPINAQADSTVDRLVELVPDVITKASAFFEERKEAKAAKAEDAKPEDTKQ